MRTIRRFLHLFVPNCAQWYIGNEVENMKFKILWSLWWYNIVTNPIENSCCLCYDIGSRRNGDSTMFWDSTWLKLLYQLFVQSFYNIIEFNLLVVYPFFKMGQHSLPTSWQWSITLFSLSDVKTGFVTFNGGDGRVWTIRYSGWKFLKSTANFEP